MFGSCTMLSGRASPNAKLAVKRTTYSHILSHHCICRSSCGQSMCALIRRCAFESSDTCSVVSGLLEEDLDVPSMHRAFATRLKTECLPYTCHVCRHALSCFNQRARLSGHLNTVHSFVVKHCETTPFEIAGGRSAQPTLEA